MKKILVFLLIFAIWCCRTHAQSVFVKNENTLSDKCDSNTKFSPVRVRGYFNLLGSNMAEQATAPLQMEKKQLLHFGLFACATSLLIISDPAIDVYAMRLDRTSKFVRTVSPEITNFGSNYSLYTVGVLELAGLIFKDKKLIITGSLATQAMITSGLFTRLGKIIFSRARPSAAYGTGSYKNGGVWHGALSFMDNWTDNGKMPGSGYDAFPSGHTATAFSVATVYAMMYKDRLAVPVISYTIASLVGLSRLTEHTHWGSDIFVGAALGYLCGRQVVKNYRLLNNVAPSLRKKNISLSLDYNRKTYFAGLNCTF
jgi:hypothetical protein